jgi:hypothetical protein
MEKSMSENIEALRKKQKDLHRLWISALAGERIAKQEFESLRDRTAAAHTFQLESEVTTRKIHEKLSSIAVEINELLIADEMARLAGVGNADS